jgi:hypothetical protein
VSKHTPGPWLANVSDDHLGNRWAEIFPASGVVGGGHYRGEICSMQSAEYLSHGHGITREEIEANAHLAAASPDLLDVVQKIVSRSVAAGQDSCGQEMVKFREALLEEARAALAKAEGGEG